MKIIDAHCHLESREFDGMLDSIISDACKAGVVKLITSSITPSQWEISRAIALKYPAVEFALGVHPWYGSLTDLADIENLKHSRDMGAVAIGEIGLDRKVDSPPFGVQLRIFERQLEIARDLNLPVILHCRGAFNELMASIKKIGMPVAGGIIHSFAGSMEIARDLMRYGLSFSLGGILTYRRNNKRARMLNLIYPDNLLLETDSPDIPPVQCMGRPNVPANIVYNLHGAAEILGVTEEEVALNTTKNAVRIFRLTI